MNFLAFDTETELIADRKKISTKSTTLEHNNNNGNVHTSPFEVPDVVLGSVCDELGSHVRDPSALAALLRAQLEDPNGHLIGHHLPFDIQVMCKRFPPLWPLFVRAADEGRLHDTNLLDVLYRLSTGYFDNPQYNPSTRLWSRPDMFVRSIDKLAEDYLDIKLDKDPNVRLGYGQFLGRPLAEVPKKFIKYAREDAIATYRVFMYLKEKLDKDKRENWLSEGTQIRASLAMAAMDQHGVRIDKKMASKLLVHFRSYLEPLQLCLFSEGLGRWEAASKSTRQKFSKSGHGFRPDYWHKRSNGEICKWKHFKSHDVMFTAPAKFCINTKAVQAKLEALGVDKPPRRADGSIQTTYDYWIQHVPAFEVGLRKWLEHEKLKKIISTYLLLYSRVEEVYPKWHVLGARSGRSSASGPSIQNVPKRKYGIRALFRPRPGRVFVKADYSAQEMYTLAESMKHLGIEGPLYHVLVSGEDIHRYGAALVLGKDISAVTKEERQGQKALNFGVPGGLGPRKLAEYANDLYGIAWTVEEAKARRQKFLKVFTDIAEYLEFMKCTQDEALKRITGGGCRTWKELLGIQTWRVIDAMKNWTRSLDEFTCRDIQEIGQRAERICNVVLPTGRVRANCRFTEAANSYFQGLAADVTKEALWKCHVADLDVVLVVHDEIVIEAPVVGWEPHAKTLQSCMLEAFREVCPNLGQYAGVEVSGALDRWGPATDPDGKVLEL